MRKWTVEQQRHQTIITWRSGEGTDRVWTLDNYMSITLPEGITQPVGECSDGQLIQFCLNY